MYTGLISMSGATAESRERAVDVIHERVIPTVRQHAGYRGYVGLFDVDNQRAMAVTSGRARRQRTPPRRSSPDSGPSSSAGSA
jgi:hypothetical protein